MNRQKSLLLIFMAPLLLSSMLALAFGLSAQKKTSSGLNDGLSRLALAGEQKTNDATKRETPPGPKADDHLLLFTAQSIDTRLAQPRVYPPTSTSGEALHLIQFSGPTQDAWLTAVTESGAEIVHYVANYGYLLWADETARARLDNLAATSDFLRYSAPYLPVLKSDRALALSQARTASAEEIVVTIQMLRHDGRAESERILNEIIIQPLTAWEPVLKFQNMRARIARADVAAITALPDVIWVGPYFEPQKTDEVQAQILAGNLNGGQTEPNGPGYVDWLLERGFSEDPAEYPIVDITDDGVGNGNAAAAAGDRTFRVDGDSGGNSRLVYANNCTAGPDGSGPDGHGHINASIAGGYDARQGAPYQDEDGYRRGTGINPFGRLGSTRVFYTEFFPRFDLSNCNDSLTALVRQSYRSGARIINNSWGCAACAGQYDPAAQEFDALVRDGDDLAPGNQELLILFSVGNSGEDGPGTVGSPANGKNVLAVGASENVRPTWTDGCLYGPEDADNAQDMAEYSSQGPAPGGRVKPDLVAPGTHVTGTASTSPFYNGTAVCDPFEPGNQQVFAASTGTSHSVPAVAGLASLATYWLGKTHGIDDPSPALLRAFLTATARYLTGLGANDTLPSNVQGFGMPDMSQAFSDNYRFALDQDQLPRFNESGETWSKEVYAFDQSQPLRIVMAFTDEPGLLTAAQPSVNNLNLVVRAGGKTYRGNQMAGQWSEPGGSADKVNTIEAVFLPPGVEGTIEISVVAANIAGNGVPGVGDSTDQDFALVCDNCRNPEDIKFAAYLPAGFATGR